MKIKHNFILLSCHTDTKLISQYENSRYLSSLEDKTSGSPDDDILDFVEKYYQHPFIE